MKEKYYKPNYDNYEIIVNKLTQLIVDNGLVLIKNNRPKPNIGTTRSGVDKILGNLKTSELQRYKELLESLLAIE